MSNKHKKNVTPKKEIFSDGPRIVFDSTVRDFGEVEPKSVLHHTFKFKNIGTEPLEIKVRPNCSCTASMLSNDTLQPGETGEIKLEFNTKDKKGVTTVKISCRTNDPGNGLVTLRLIADIARDVFIVTTQLYVGKTPENNKIKKILRIYKASKSPFEITSVDCPDGIQAKILPSEENIQYDYAIPVEISIDRLSESNGNENNIVIHTKGKTQKKITVPVIGSRQNGVKIYPRQLILNNVKENESIERIVAIKGLKSEAVDIENITTSDKHLSVQIIKSDTSNERQFKITFHAPDTAAIYRGECKIKISNATVPELSIPVLAKVIE